MLQSRVVAPNNVPLYALFGDPVEGSLSPAMQNAAFLAAGYKGTYLPFRADATSLPHLFAALRAESLSGANFTYPCKEAAAALCDSLAAEAAAVRAVNTVRIDGAVEGFNTDVYGFERALAASRLAVKSAPVLILGTGATARALGFVLERAGGLLTYATRERTRPQPLASGAVTIITLDEAARHLAMRRPVLVANATPSGLRASDAPLFDYGAIPEGTFIFDANYGRETPLLAAARARGLPYSDGLSMLVFQGARAFEIWTGQEAPVAVMRGAAETEFRKRRL